MASLSWLSLAARALSIAIAVDIVGTSAPVWAQESSIRDSAAARTLFQEGVECADRGEWDCAADRFSRAYTLRASPVIAYNLGHALVQAGRLVEGVEVLRGVARDEGAPANVRADARRVIADGEPRIARLRVALTGPDAGVTITIDARELPRSLVGTAAPVDPGERLVEAWREGEVIASARLAIVEGEEEEVELTIPALAAPARSDVPAPEAVARAALEPGAGPTLERGRDDTGWIVLGVTGGVLLASAAVVLAIVLATPTEERPFEGNLGRVEIGR